MSTQSFKEASESEAKRKLHEFITEHYGFSPENFTSRAVDVANDVIYDTVDKVEAMVVHKFGESNELDLVRARLLLFV